MHADHGSHAEPEDTVARTVRRGTHIAALALVAGILLLIIGGQAWLKQADDDRDDARISAAVAELKRTTDCVRAWGEDFATTTTTRTGGRQEAGSIDLERATERRARALDQIILTVIAFREIPPAADDEDFDRVLKEYAASLRNLRQVQRDVDTTRTLNPYPKLDCDDKKE